MVRCALYTHAFAIKGIELTPSDMNSYYFNTRTRAFNNMWYWISQVIGAGAFGVFLDNTRFSRRTRLWIGWGSTFVLMNAIWGGGVAFLLKTNRSVKSPHTDIFDHNYTWYLIVCLSIIQIHIHVYICIMTVLIPKVVHALRLS